MDTLNRINEIYDKLDSFLYNEFVLILLVFLIAALLFNLFVRKETNYKRSWTFIIVYGVFLWGMLFLFSEGKKELVNERNQLVKDYYSDFTDTASVEIKDIIEIRNVKDEFCPHVRMKVNEECRLIEFYSDNGLMQVFMPITEQYNSTFEEGSILEYLQLTEEEQYVFEREYNLNWNDGSFRLIHNRWVLGVYELSK